MTSAQRAKLPGGLRYGRQYAIAYDEARMRVTFECKETGHKFTETWGPNAPKKRNRTIAPQLLRRFATSYWTKANNGCQGVCPKCVLAWRKEHARTA